MKIEQKLLVIEDPEYDWDLLEHRDIKKYIDEGFVVKQISSAGAGAKLNKFLCFILLERTVEE